MLRTRYVLLLALLAAANARAGTVSFTPLGDTKIYNDSAFGPTMLDFTVRLNDDFGPEFFAGFTAAIVHIDVSGDVNVSFEPDEEFPWTPWPDPGPHACNHNICLTFFNPFVPRFLPIELGTVTVDAERATVGDYEILVSGSLGDPTGSTEAVVRSGDANFQVIPEPSTLVLLAVGLLGMSRGLMPRSQPCK